MAIKRADPFGDNEPDVDFSDFVPAAPARPPVSKEAIRAVSEAHSFPSRAVPPEAVSVPAPPPARRYRTGRNVQFNTRVTPATLERAHRLIAQFEPMAMGELLEMALDAFERELALKRAEEIPGVR